MEYTHIFIVILLAYNEANVKAHFVYKSKRLFGLKIAVSGPGRMKSYRNLKIKFQFNS